jgi:putative DNA primase/helicase
MVVSYADSIPMNREFVASNVLATCGSLLSSKVQLALKQQGPWEETPNCWALNIAPVSSHKTPGLKPAREALNRVEERYRHQHQLEIAAYQSKKIIYDAQVKSAKAAAAKGHSLGSLPVEPVAPEQRRAVTNNVTYQALSTLAEHGPIVLLDDEASGLFAEMTDPKNQPAKAFYLAAHAGSGSFQTDRVGRGAVFIPRLCVSIIGNIQPEPLLRILLGAAREGRQADGFVQRFGFMTMPDPLLHTELVDLPFDFSKWTAGQDAIVKLVDYDPSQHGAVASMLGTGLPYFKLSDAANAIWRAEYARQLAEAQNTELLEAYRQHVMKQPKLIATVALVIHALEGHEGDISGPVMERAVAASRFYLSHAKRIYYMSAHDIYAEPARVIANRMARGDITGEFTAREAQRKGWTGCVDPDATTSIMALLEDADWIRPVVQAASQLGGRPSKRWQVNPLAQGAKC